MNLLEEIFGPHNAVNGFRGRVANGAPWEGFLCRFRLALVAFCLTLHFGNWRECQEHDIEMKTCQKKVDSIEDPYLLDNSDLSQIASRAALNEGNVGSQTHSVDVIPGRCMDNRKDTFLDGIKVVFIHFCQDQNKPYLCCPKRSWQAGNSWRIPHCNLGCKEQKTTTLEIKLFG